MNSKLDVNALMERNKSDLKAAEETMPMVAVDNRNWTAVISLLKRSCEVQEELLKSQGELMTKQDSVNLVNQQIRIQRETLKNLEQHQEETIQMLRSSTQELQSQAGKLNEEFSSQRRELEEWKHRTQLKMLRAIVISQSVLLILSLALQMWLR